MKRKHILLWIICAVIVNILPAQHNNHWVIFNTKSPFDKDYDKFYPAINVDFNSEPPVTTEYPNPKGFYLEGNRHNSLCDKFGNLSLVSSLYQGFFNDTKSIYKLTYPDSFFYSHNISSVFPTDNDSLYVVFYTQKLPNKQIYYFGYFDYKFRYGIYNIYTKKFVITNQISNLPPKHQNKLSTYNYYGQLRGLYFMWQYIDQKARRYWFFYNIRDSVYAAEFDTKNRNFKAPVFSGLRTEMLPGNIINSSYTSIYTGVIQTDRLIFNSTGTKAYYFDIGKRANVFGNSYNYSSICLLSYDFNRETGKFTNETVIDSAESISTGWYTYYQRFNASDIALSASDSILYMSVYQENSKTSYKIYKYVLGSNGQFTRYSYPYPDNKWPDRLSLAPNGKIYVIPSWKSSYPADSFIMAIDNPDDPGPLLKYNPKGIRIYSDFAATKTNTIKLGHFPNAFGLHRRVAFSVSKQCQDAMQFVNLSDTFWFRHFRYYFGNGDSIDFDRRIKTITYKYPERGKYVVKLRAFTREGSSVWYSDSITVSQAPNAYFTLGLLTGCQWSGYNLFDSSYVFRTSDKVTHRWIFGNPKDSVWSTTGDIYEKRNMRVVYQKDGIYTVYHIVDDGYCIDTFSRTNQVIILPAPRPGIVATPATGCTPVDIKLKAKYVNQVDSVLWFSNGGHSQLTTASGPISFTFNNPGNFTVWQKQYGVTGCITTDTISLDIVKGFDAGVKPHLISASHNSNTEIALVWTGQKYTNSYTIWRNGSRITHISDTFFTDKNFKPGANVYEISASDYCGGSGEKSNTAQTMQLTGKDVDGIALLAWNPYQTWHGGVQTYKLEYQDAAGNYEPVKTMPGNNTTYTDSTFMSDGFMEKCFRITAYENGGFNALSHSNTLCMPYRALIWIPNAVSPNGDGINDIVDIRSYGISEMVFSVYDRWGAKIFETDQLNAVWDPKNEANGVYLYMLQAATDTGGHRQMKGTITVIR